MKAIIFGLGSIGSRHMRLLQTYFPEVEIWHYNRYAIEPYEKLVDTARWKHVECILQPDDFAIISNPTEAHLSCARACAEMGLNLFIEKPICTNSDGLDDLIRMVREKNLVAYVAYPLRFHPFVEYLKTIPPAGNYRFVCHTNAERWPSARKLDHVVLELSHELDIAEYLLGSVRGIRGDSSPDGRRAKVVCNYAGGARSEFSLRLDSKDEQRFIGIGNHQYPIWADDGVYLKQWAHFIGRLRRKAVGAFAVTRNDLAPAAGLFRVMEEFVKEAIHKKKPTEGERANEREKPNRRERASKGEKTKVVERATRFEKTSESERAIGFEKTMRQERARGIEKTKKTERARVNKKTNKAERAMEVLITILARRNSKGLPGKNTRLMHGKPLIQWTIEQAQEWAVEHGDAVIAVSSDDPEVKEIAISYGLWFIHRPAELASDSAGKVAAIRHAWQRAEHLTRKVFDCVIDLDVTNPMRRVVDIETVCKCMDIDPPPLTVFSATKARKNPYFNQYPPAVAVRGSERDAKSWAIVHRRQDAPKTWDLNCCIYAYSREFMLSNLQHPITDRSVIYEMHDWSAFDIDSELDFFIVEQLMEHYAEELGKAHY